MLRVKYLSVLNTTTNAYGKNKTNCNPIIIPSDKLQFSRKKLDDPHVSQFLKETLLEK